MTAFRALALAVTIVVASIAPLAGQAPAAAKPIQFKYVEWNYLDEDGKAKKKSMFIELHAEEIRIVPRYPERGKTLEAQSQRIPYAGLTDVTSSQTAGGSTVNMGFGFTSTGNWHWLTIKTADKDYVLKLMSSVNSQLLSAELDRRRKGK